MVPDTLAGWRVTGGTLVGLRRVTARKGQRTLVIVGSQARGWDVTTMRGGKVLGTTTVRHLPPAVRQAIM